MLFPYDEDEWSEDIDFGGFKVGTSTFLVETMGRYLTRVVDEYDTDPLPQMRLSSLLHARTLVGEDLVERWRAKAVAYPTPLAPAMVGAHLDVEPFGYAAEMLAARDDAVVLDVVVARAERGVLGALLDPNGISLPDPGVKSMDGLIGDMRLAPVDLAARLKRVFRLPPRDGVRELRAVIEETLSQIGTHLPGVDTTPYRAALDRPRGVWDRVPEM